MSAPAARARRGAGGLSWRPGGLARSRRRAGRHSSSPCCPPACADAQTAADAHRRGHRRVGGRRAGRLRHRAKNGTRGHRARPPTPPGATPWPTSIPGSTSCASSWPGFKTVVRGGVVLRVGGGQRSVDVTLGRRAARRGGQVVVRDEPLIGARPRPTCRRVVGDAGDRVAAEHRPQLRGLREALERRRARAARTSAAGPSRSRTPAWARRPRRASASAASRSSTRLVQVDGVDNVQTFTGLPRATPSQEAVREFRILNSTYLAEYGRALGGFVNIVTKSGTNDHQRLRLLLRDERRPGLALDPQRARRRRAEPAPVRRHAGRPAGQGPHLLLR